MAQATFHNDVQFDRAIGRLIERARAQGRGDDLDRMIAHLEAAPTNVSRLASLLLLVDEDFRGPLKAEVDAYRRFCAQKGRVVADDEVVSRMLDVYRHHPRR
jgi:hypothetical protein